MARLSPAIVFATCLVALQAHAGITSFSIQGTLTDPAESLRSTYPAGSPFNAVVNIDDAIAPAIVSDTRYYYGLSGTVDVNGNTIRFGDSLGYLWSASHYTQLSILGGNAWNTGGTISETQAPTGFAVSGFQIQFTYPPAWRA